MKTELNLNLITKSKVSIDIIVSTITGVLILIAVIYSTKLFAQNLGPYNFGLYSISRRLITTIYVFYSAGLTIGATRYIALNKHCYKTQKSFIFLSFLFIIISALMVVTIFVLTSNFSSDLLLGNAKFAKLLLSSNYLLIALAFSSILIAVYRGNGYIIRANIIQLFSFAIVPIIIGLFFSKNHSSIFVIKIIGLLTLIFISIPFIIEFIKSIKPAIELGLKTNIENFINLLKYSLPRLPANLALAGLFTIGPYLLVKMGKIESAGYLSASQNLLRMVDISAAGVGFVLLPKVSELVGLNQVKKLANISSILLGFSIHTGIYLSLHLALFADQITFIWLGKDYYKAIPLMQITLLATGFYLAYVNLRSVIDAVEFKPINAFNTIISLAIVTGMSLFILLIGINIIYMAIAVTIGFICLGILSLLYLHKKYSIGTEIYKYKHLISLNVLLLFTSYFFKNLLIAHSTHFYNIWLMAGIEVILFLIYNLLTKLAKISWMDELKSYIRIGL